MPAVPESHQKKKMTCQAETHSQRDVTDVGRGQRLELLGGMVVIILSVCNACTPEEGIRIHGATVIDGYELLSGCWN